MPAYILDRNGEMDRSRLGGKAAALAHLVDADFSIPPWFVITPDAFEASVTRRRLRALEKSADSGAISAVLQALEPSKKVLGELEKALAQLAPNGERLAVRSSAVDEDGAERSFAGQLESYLFVPADEVAARMVDVWRSGFSERVLSYRIEAGLPPMARAPAVLVQRMVDAERAGVAFSADPVSGRRDVTVVSAVHGLGSALVSGESDGDTWHVDSGNRTVQRYVTEKPLAQRFDPEARDYLGSEPVNQETAKQPVLTDEEAVEVAKVACRAAEFFGKPQDIEWAYEKGQFYLLQSRPITTLNDLPDPAGERILWDNSNIAESYGGVTTPLTFSFARRAYESVYREFCRILGVPESAIIDNETTFRRMLGLIRGRVYYNLLSWYRVLALLPGFTVNRRFMEQMMGVKDGLPDAIVKELAQGSKADRVRDALRLAGTLLGLVVNLLILPRKIDHFYRRLDEALAHGEDLAGKSADQLVAYYRGLERKLLTRWDAPLINDFFAMIFYGVLRKLCTTWCRDSEGSLQNDLLAGEGGMVSAEPAKRMRDMAEMLRDDEGLTQLLIEGELDTINRELPARVDFHTAYRRYLDKFGDRCLDELKLESPSLHDDPLLLLRSIGQLALRIRQGKASAASQSEAAIRAAAEARVAAELNGQTLRRLVFNRVLSQARARVRDRENLRFERTRLFGRVRRVFVELGKHLYAGSLLDHHRDVFYLEVEEVLGFVEGTTVTTDLKGLVRVRREEYEQYQRMEPPGDRFETRGMVHQGNRFEGAAETELPAGGDLKGIGCCPGVVRGPVRIIRDPRNAVLNSGEILVAERTDPGWIMLFPIAAGILVERGSLLSHAAIVAREMGIPAIVSIPAVTRTLRNGEWVEFDGRRGVVRRLGEDAVGDAVRVDGTDSVE